MTPTEPSGGLPPDLAALRARLLQTAHETPESLSRLRGETADVTRAWLDRSLAAGTIFDVPHDGQAVLPAFQFDPAGAVRPESAAVVQQLRAVGLDGWQLWEWMCAPTGWLDGDVPAELLEENPAEVRTAAQYHALELWLGRRTSETRHLTT